MKEIRNEKIIKNEKWKEGKKEIKKQRNNEHVKGNEINNATKHKFEDI